MINVLMFYCAKIQLKILNKCRKKTTIKYLFSFLNILKLQQIIKIKKNELLSMLTNISSIYLKNLSKKFEK